VNATPVHPLVDQVAAFARKRLGKYLEKWPDGRLEEYLQWFQRWRLLIVLADAEGQVAAIALGRPVRKSDADKHYSIDRRGDTMAVDMVIADTPAAREIVWETLCTIVGPREWIAYRRLKYGDRTAIHSFSRFNSNVRKLPL